MTTLERAKTDLRCSTYLLTLKDLDTLLQVQLTVALLSKLTHDVTRESRRSVLANTRLDQWLDVLNEAPIDEIMLASKNKAAHV